MTKLLMSPVLYSLNQLKLQIVLFYPPNHLDSCSLYAADDFCMHLIMYWYSLNDLCKENRTVDSAKVLWNFSIWTHANKDNKIIQKIY